MADTKYLEWHGQQWRVRIDVPRDLRAILGKAALKEALGTADLKRANELKWPVVAKLKGIITSVKQSAASNDPITAEALTLRLKGQTDLSDDERDNLNYEIAIRAEQIEDRQGEARAIEYAKIAFGTVTPLDHHAEDFLAFKSRYGTKTKGDFKRTLDWLGGWLRRNDHPQTVEVISRRVAAQFITGFLLVGRSKQKAQAYCGFLSEYWKWLIGTGVIDGENPWTGQPWPTDAPLPPDAEPDPGKRPYTDTELATLIHGPADTLLNDLMRIAALSGMRLEEICQLRAQDCADGGFEIRDGKTANAKRSVPIHPDLEAIVERRTEGKQPAEYLIDELPKPPPSRDGRSDPAGKKFGHYRRSMGVDERPNDKRVSNVEFHSFRRWFIKQARDALTRPSPGFLEWTLADVVGHSDGGTLKTLSLTMRDYPGPSSDDAKQACVLAAQLPPPPIDKEENNDD